MLLIQGRLLAGPRIMKNWNIKTRVILLALIPSIIISVLLGSDFTLTRFKELEEQVQREGTFITAELTAASKYALTNNDQSVLQNLAETSVENVDIAAVAIFDKNKNLVAYSGPDSSRVNINPKNNKKTDLLNTVKLNGHYFFTQPIILPQNHITKSGKENIIGWVTIDFDPSRIRLEQYQALMMGALILILGLALSTLFGLRIGRDITRPLIVLRDAVTKIKDGDLNTRVDLNIGGEFRNLEEGINSMAAALKFAQTEMQDNIDQATKELKESLETVEIQNVELDLARKEALEASRVKSEFIANISHEIRTPMNSVIGFTNLLLETNLTPHQRDYLETIRKSATNLLGIINDILDFSKLEVGKLRLHYIPMSMRECVEDVLEILAPNAHSKDLELTSIIDSHIPSRIIGDPLRIKQVITNLVGNAIKFTQSGSVEITVKLDKEIDNNYLIRVGVTDTGLGLSKEEQKQLFRAFGQTDTTVRRKYGGTGLGLVISKKLINQMGGTIGVNSEPGQGSTFWFTFISEKANSIASEMIEYKRLAHYRVAIYEPHPTTRLSLQFLLSAWDMEVLVCESIEDLIMHVSHPGNVYDLALIGMKHIDEPNLSNVIEQVKVQSNTLLVVLANTHNPDIFSQYDELGIDLCLGKPITQKKLYHELCTLLLEKSNIKPNAINAIAQTYNNNKKNEHVPLLPLKVLAVDDNSANLKLLLALLEKLGIQAVQADNGAKALAITAQQLFDLIFMDIQMPNMDGLEVTNRIRKPNHLNRHTPIVAISAHVIGYEKETLLAAGINDYLTKPINVEQLNAAIYKWTRLSSLEQKQSENIDLKAIAAPVQPIHNDKIIDMELGTKLAGGKIELAQEMLQMLLDNLGKDQEIITQTYQQNDLIELKHHVHKLHGAACYCGVPRLKSSAHQLETALKENKHDKLDLLFNTLINEINLVLEKSNASVQ